MPTTNDCWLIIQHCHRTFSTHAESVLSPFAIHLRSCCVTRTDQCHHLQTIHNIKHIWLRCHMPYVPLYPRLLFTLCPYSSMKLTLAPPQIRKTSPLLTSSCALVAPCQQTTQLITKMVHSNLIHSTINTTATTFGIQSQSTPLPVLLVHCHISQNVT